VAEAQNITAGNVVQMFDTRIFERKVIFLMLGGDIVPSTATVRAYTVKGLKV